MEPTNVCIKKIYDYNSCSLGGNDRGCLVSLKLGLNRIPSAYWSRPQGQYIHFKISTQIFSFQFSAYSSAKDEGDRM